MKWDEGVTWTLEDNKLFEKALAVFEEETHDRWDRVAATVPGKSVDEVRRHYEDLVEDVGCIDAGYIEVPSYKDKVDDELKHSSKHLGNVGDNKSGGERGLVVKSSSEQERKKGVPWTEEEHRMFLLGLHKYGKGDWKSISRNFVVSRTPTQVASHAQKYFIRCNSGHKDKRRSSIHDITSVNNTDMRQSLGGHPSPIPMQNSISPINPSSLLISQSSSMGGLPFVNSVGFATENNNLMLPSRGLGLYGHGGFQVHSSGPLISRSSMGVSHIGYHM
ncbi:hypothetical protein KI387_025056 [Taxus chinensis]|uniref:Uncharacterized protein n=1 Tax=Taxus chinensis TaxID=29808 RepID=A0AA38L921_TAXCH|nr:hypothetical protein KI387_025056 [Taxus chinensis]